jgi:hypothetical protein
MPDLMLWHLPWFIVVLRVKILGLSFFIIPLLGSELYGAGEAVFGIIADFGIDDNRLGDVADYYNGEEVLTMHFLDRRYDFADGFFGWDLVDA